MRKDFRAITADDARTVAAAALSRTLSRPVCVDTVRDLGGEERRNLILRARAAAEGTEPRSVIIKATRDASYDPGSADAYATSGFVKEWAAAACLARLDPARPPVAALLAHDLEAGVLVFEDLGELPSLVGPLLHGTASEAETALTAYAVSLAELHRLTTGCRDGHAAVLAEGYPSSKVLPPASRWTADVAAVPFRLLGGDFPEDDIGTVAGRLARPGPWQALVHGDPCPDNVLLAPGGPAVLIDFEFARPSHALLDAAYWRMGCPTCWCAGTVPADTVRRLDLAYRTALGGHRPGGRRRRRVRHESALIDTAWMLGNLAWLLEGTLGGDQIWGRAANRSRILTYLEKAIRSAEEADILPRLRAVAATWQDGLRSRWPDAVPLSAFPAFAAGRE